MNNKAENKKRLNDELYKVVNDIKVSSAIRCKKVKYLIYLGADVNAKNFQGMTALMSAVFKNDLDMVSLLIENGADVNVKGTSSDEYKTPLMVAVMKENLEIARLLVENGANVDEYDGVRERALEIAVGRDNFEIAKLLIDNGSDVNKGGFCGMRVLQKVKSVKLAQMLIEKGAELDARDYFGKTAIMSLAEVALPRIDVIKYLLELGADVDTRTRNGKDMLGEFDLEIVKLLKEYKKKNKEKNKDKSFWGNILNGWGR